MRIKNNLQIKYGSHGLLRQEILYMKQKKYVCSFQQFKTIRSFAKNIFAGKTNLNDTNKDQSN